MVGTERLLGDREGTLVRWLSLGIPALSKVRSHEVVEADADTRVAGGRAPSRSYERDVRMVGASAFS
jgi:hypothetical protein